MCFHETCTSTKRVLPHVYFHAMCTLHDTSKRGPPKYVIGMHCSIVVVPRKITQEKMKLQLSGTIAKCLDIGCDSHTMLPLRRYDKSHMYHVIIKTQTL